MQKTCSNFDELNPFEIAEQSRPSEAPQKEGQEEGAQDGAGIRA